VVVHILLFIDRLVRRSRRDRRFKVRASFHIRPSRTASFLATATRARFGPIVLISLRGDPDYEAAIDLLDILASNERNHLVNAAASRQPRRRCAFSQADLSRALRAAEQRGGWRVEYERDGVIIRLTREPSPVTTPAPDGRGLTIVP
jgi:hypothetical protein